MVACTLSFWCTNHLRYLFVEKNCSYHSWAWNICLTNELLIVLTNSSERYHIKLRNRKNIVRSVHLFYYLTILLPGFIIVIVYGCGFQCCWPGAGLFLALLSVVAVWVYKKMLYTQCAVSILRLLQNAIMLKELSWNSTYRIALLLLKRTSAWLALPMVPEGRVGVRCGFILAVVN